MFTKLPPESLFLYADPFVVPATLTNVTQYTLPYFDDLARLDEDRIKTVVLRFAAENQIVESDGTSFVPSSITDTGSWIWLINRTNMRSLVDKEQYTTLLRAMEAPDAIPLHLLLDLHARLGGLFSFEVLNTLCNRTLRSIKLIPYQCAEGSQALSWEQIHQQTPFLWLVVYLQNLIRSKQ